jgi:hypothetical protein
MTQVDTLQINKLGKRDGLLDLTRKLCEMLCVVNSHCNAPQPVWGE